ncbi:CDP-glucose 4,6-dehydratase [Halarcobacter ebronensis]|uniref:CDP-glucose 4,6-dehydratase n=1 Tax=Halarcobacter ebronensis TaxID=1462615 RepID=A0A4Q0YFK6_9BACT|nr:CDP-glucose 4,6-dehydratase [Halarcobacter ebronensis]RXJ69003.1 CDP-glucose 4,6-dehydratase [Halarcobacter ebronensis]
MFNNIYKNKKVLVTGHTGFKGTWLTTWLLKLGAKVVGISKDIPSHPSMFEELKIEEQITHYKEDIRNLEKMVEIISSEKPEFLFHLAAQPIVSVSYSDPIETISSNVMGTTNILEALKKSNHKCTAVIITSDKAYDNVEQVWGYKEDDKMGGKDVYSGSKGATELIIKSYYHSFFKKGNCNIKLAIGRAGNVIGGGDWAQDRIVVDCMEAWSKKEIVEIRAPKATRPWQHVLEPLSGYLNLGQKLYEDNSLHGEGFNFGPRAEQNHTVEELLIDLSKYWHFENALEAYKVTGNIPFHEAGLLKLNCDKALFYLKWQANLEYKDTIRFTSEWYYDFYKTNKDILQKTLEQIEEYESKAKEKGLKWTE